MKIRTGYVSNSSSASFIIKWGAKNNREMTLEQALRVFKDDLCGYSFIEEETKDLASFTKENGNGKFTTEFYTTMLNCGEDFGEIAKSFLIWVVTSENFEMLDYKVDRD